MKNYYSASLLKHVKLFYLAPLAPGFDNNLPINSTTSSNINPTMSVPMSGPTSSNGQGKKRKIQHAAGTYAKNGNL